MHDAETETRSLSNETQMSETETTTRTVVADCCAVQINPLTPTVAILVQL